MRTLSPVEMMVDKACGFEPGSKPPEPKQPSLDAATTALLEVADAAKAWRKAFVPRTPREKRLVAAVDEWVRHGG